MEVTVGKIMINSTNVPARIPNPVPPKTLRMAGTTTLRPMNPYTTDGIPTKRSMTGWSIFAPHLVAISVINKAAPMAKGVAIIAAKKVTPKLPTIIGKAPTSGLPWGPVVLGDQLVLLKKSQRFTLFW